MRPIRSLSSSAENLPFLIPGLAILSQRCRHCMLSWPGTMSAIAPQLRPCWLTAAARSASSSFGHLLVSFDSVFFLLAARLLEDGFSGLPLSTIAWGGNLPFKLLPMNAVIFLFAATLIEGGGMYCSCLIEGGGAEAGSALFSF